MNVNICKKVLVMQEVPADITSFEWIGVTHLTNLLCTLCEQPIGNKRFAIAFIKEENKGQYSARLCENCGMHIYQQMRQA